jgi:MFS family permease
VSVAPILLIAALLVLLAHLGGGAQWTLSTYGLQVRAPDEIRGRILAADFAFVTLILSVTTTAAGALASVAGPRPTIATFALLGVAAGTGYLLLTRHLRRDLRQEELAGTVTVPVIEEVDGIGGADDATGEPVSRPGPP